MSLSSSPSSICGGDSVIRVDSQHNCRSFKNVGRSSPHANVYHQSTHDNCNKEPWIPQLLMSMQRHCTVIPSSSLKVQSISKSNHHQWHISLYREHHLNTLFLIPKTSSSSFTIADSNDLAINCNHQNSAMIWISLSEFLAVVQ